MNKNDNIGAIWDFGKKIVQKFTLALLLESNSVKIMQGRFK